MATSGFLFLWFLLQLGAVILGTVSHWFHTNFYGPERLFDGGRVRDHVANTMLGREYVWFGDYDEAGVWEFDSLKNWLIHVLPLSFGAFIFMLTQFSDRANVVAKFCGLMHGIGMKPPFCF